MTDDARPGLQTDKVRETLRAPWTSFEVVAETESTNSDLIGAPAGTVLAAEYQRAGRGRLDRVWTSPARAGLIVSAVVAPRVGPAVWSWLPLLTGVAVSDAVERVTGIATALKWPNDILIGELKVAGILVQVDAASAIIGVGLNVSTTRAELPVETATSLELAGAAPVDRSALLAAVLDELGRRYDEWTDAAGDAVASGLAAAYRARCSTIGREVAVITTGGERRATAVGVEEDGRLRVRWTAPTEAGLAEQTLAAGDIVHLMVGPAGRST